MSGWGRLARVVVLVAASSVVWAPVAVADEDPGYNGAPTVRSGGPVPTMNGVPCVGGKLGVCVGFAQNSPDRPPPRSAIGHTPTIGN